MIRFREFVIACSLFGAPCAALAQSTGAPVPPPRPSDVVPKANPADVSSIDAILSSLYDVISGNAGQTRNWQRMQSLFIPGARLIPTSPHPGGGTTVRVLSLDDWIARVTPAFEKSGFYEKQVAVKIERYGNVAHAFSTYESRHSPSDAVPFARGINSIQLAQDGDRWFVVTIFWDAERPDNPIPAQYLPARH
jgi:hypothetical protein